MKHTIDSLIESPQARNAAGAAGDTPVRIPPKDNNGQNSSAPPDFNLGISTLVKRAHAKGWTICKPVTPGSAPILLVA